MQAVGREKPLIISPSCDPTCYHTDQTFVATQPAMTDLSLVHPTYCVPKLSELSCLACQIPHQPKSPQLPQCTP